MYHEQCVDTRPTDVARRHRNAGAGRLLALPRTWHERSCQRRQLLQLDERMFRDMGVTADEALREARKPFWRE